MSVAVSVAGARVGLCGGGVAVATSCRGVLAAVGGWCADAVDAVSAGAPRSLTRGDASSGGGGGGGTLADDSARVLMSPVARCIGGAGAATMSDACAFAVPAAADDDCGNGATSGDVCRAVSFPGAGGLAGFGVGTVLSDPWSGGFISGAPLGIDASGTRGVLAGSFCSGGTACVSFTSAGPDAIAGDDCVFAAATRG